MKHLGVKSFFLWMGLFLLGSTAVWGMTTPEIMQAYYKSYNYEKLQDFRDAVDALSPVVREYPKGYTVNLRLGWLYYLKENYADSLQHYAQAMKVAPQSIEAKLGYMLPLMVQRRYDLVETMAYQILRTDRYNYYANLRLAVALRHEKKYEDAAKILQQMLTLYPIDVTFLTELGLVREAEGKVTAAAAIFTDVLILDPENPTANARIGKKDGSRTAN
jgi:cytochrome c-type biogenesis protein CcmH/NrfG